MARVGNLLASVILVFGGTSCINLLELLEDDSISGLDFSRVVLVDTEWLEPPAVGVADAFRPTYRATIDAGDAESGELIGFVLTVSAASDAVLHVRYVDSASDATQELQAVDPPSDSAGAPAAESDAVRDLLRAGQGVYWVTAGDQQPLVTQRVTVLLPDTLLSQLARLTVYASQASDGTPIGGAEIVLTERFFYLAVIGDSIQWGNGLQEQDKMSSLVARAIEDELKLKVVVQRYAQSGAKIVPGEEDEVCPWGCYGEAPRVSTSITAQADLIDRPDLMDVILMDGCINDVEIGVILNPFLDHTEIESRTIQFCQDEMTTLLAKVRALAPQAKIVVTGYFPIVGPDSNVLALEELMGTFGYGIDQPGLHLVDDLTEHSSVFHGTASASLEVAVAAANAACGGEPCVTFVDPGISAENALFTAAPLLWGLTTKGEFFEELGLGFDLFPEDPVAVQRVNACLETYELLDAIGCIYASVGHPNRDGAARYADAVMARLRELGVLNPGE